MNEDEIEEHQPLQIEEPNYTTKKAARFLWRESHNCRKIHSDLISFKEALDREDKTQWINAVDKEMDSLSANEVWNCQKAEKQ